MKKIFENTPLGISAIALAFASLGNLLAVYGEAFRVISVIISFVLLTIFVLKLIFTYKSFKTDLNNPVAFGILPTCTMAAMLLAAYFSVYVGSFATIVWYTSFVLHLFIMLMFTKRFVLKFNVQAVMPTWFIVAAGIAVAGASSAAFGYLANTISVIAFFVGFVLYVIALPLVIYKLIKYKLPEPALPTRVIFAAPASLIVVSASVLGVSDNIIWVFAVISFASYIYALIFMFLSIKPKFLPTYASFSFPMVISALAFRALNVYHFIEVIAIIVAVLATCYALFAYILHICKKI